jgi:hypothetical protein
MKAIQLPRCLSSVSLQWEALPTGPLHGNEGAYRKYTDGDRTDLPVDKLVVLLQNDCVVPLNFGFFLVLLQKNINSIFCKRRFCQVMKSSHPE